MALNSIYFSSLATTTMSLKLISNIVQCEMYNKHCIQKYSSRKIHQSVTMKCFENISLLKIDHTSMTKSTVTTEKKILSCTITKKKQKQQHPSIPSHLYDTDYYLDKQKSRR